MEELTAVEKFSLHHDMRQLPRGESSYRELIPKTTPGPGQQYAFEVNLDQCTGCKACVVACHNENGLDEDETWRSVGLIHGGTTQAPVVQHVTTACHHCLDPACSDGCPVNAYEKDSTTGVVKHLDDQCIGCQYCTFTCPYDVPKYNKKRGIVHKCDMCISRLKVGEAPACVRACPSGAIRITLVETATVKKDPAHYVNIPEAPDSRYTQPTTKYLSKKEFPKNMVSMDFYSIHPEHSHWPLILMLVLTQLSVGTFCVIAFLQKILPAQITSEVLPYYVFVAFVVGILALLASVFHLGRPLYAFRAIIGLKKSWLSREMLVFGLFALLATIYAVGFWGNLFEGKMFASDGLSLATALSGLLGIFCSVMVYKKTKRPFWDNHEIFLKFFLTAVILGISSILLMTMFFLFVQGDAPMFLTVENVMQLLVGVLIAGTSVKLIADGAVLLNLGDTELTSLKKTALLMNGPLRVVTIWRFICGGLGGIVLPIIFLGLTEIHGLERFVAMACFIFIFCLSGEFLERYLFFRAVVPFKMPGTK